MIIGGMSGRRAMHPGMARRPVFLFRYREPMPAASAPPVRKAPVPCALQVVTPRIPAARCT